ncbi:MAG TPA: hypothetical protein V6D34_15710 [Candidatus Sericytochromatia bacterium]
MPQLFCRAIAGTGDRCHLVPDSDRVKNFDRSVACTLRLYNQKGIHFRPQTRLALVNVKAMIPIL